MDLADEPKRHRQIPQALKPVFQRVNVFRYLPDVRNLFLAEIRSLEE
jgi:hypothetical protein